MVETTPVVWHDRLYRFEWIRNDQWNQAFGAALEFDAGLGEYLTSFFKQKW